MEPTASVDVRRPVDDRPVADVLLGIFGYTAIRAAHRLKLFPLLAGRPRTLQDVCDALGIKRRPAEAILAVAAALGFVERTQDGYTLTPIAEQYLLETGPRLLRFRVSAPQRCPPTLVGRYTTTLRRSDLPKQPPHGSAPDPFPSVPARRPS